MIKAKEFKKCKVCGINFVPQHNAMGKYCSYSCSGEARKARVKKICKECGIEFETHLCRIGKYCSGTCQRKGRRTTTLKKCKYCKEQFEFKPSQLNVYIGAGQYCSRQCNYDDINEKSKIKAQTVNPKKPIKNSAHKKWQAAVRDRDGRICQRCGIYEYYCHTHHVKTRAQYPELMYDVNNGICLCGSCHSVVHHHPKQACIEGWLYVAKHKDQFNSPKPVFIID